MAVHSGDQWQSVSRCLFGVDRWKVRFMSTGGSVEVKGISEADAYEIAKDRMGRVYRSRVWVFSDRSEQLDPWEEADPWENR